MLIPWFLFIALIACAGLCGGCLIKTQQRTATIVLPRSSQPQLSYTIELQSALNAILDTRLLPKGTLHTTIVNVDENDAHITIHGVASAKQLTMKINAEYRLDDNTIWWQGTSTGSFLASKPVSQQLYASSFAHARRELCYDVARNLNTQILNR